MFTFIRTSAENIDFIYLVNLLDAELAVIDGEEHAFYNQYNQINNIKNVVVVYQNNIPVACGAIKELEFSVAEVKRMFTVAGLRGRGVASALLAELEKWAYELGFSFCRLETGIRQPDAIRLYKKNGYCIIPNYGQYAGVENSCCFEKKLPIQA